MIPVPNGVRVWLTTGHTDMRKGFESLALVAQESLKRNPYDGDLFIFRGRRGDVIKIVWHDGQAACLFLHPFIQAPSFMNYNYRSMAIRITRQREKSPNFRGGVLECHHPCFGIPAEVQRKMTPLGRRLSAPSEGIPAVATCGELVLFR
jgi:hypothetical protein